VKGIHEGVTIHFDGIAAAVRARMDWGAGGTGARRDTLQTPVLRTSCYEGQAAGRWRGVAERWVGFPDCGAPTQGSTRQGSASMGYHPEGRWPSRQGRQSMAQDVIDPILVRENLGR
jgi:hypothetical protein